ncbi:MAG: type II 3-dehydroquinate dehydratase [Gemmatimonadota bacterium]
MRRIGLLNGPNLNLLGSRQPALYGSTSFDDLLGLLERRASELGVGLDAYQSNHEGDLVDRLQAWAREPDLAGVVINPGGLAHTSVVLRDAVTLLACPAVEVHLTNIAAREPFRRHSLISEVVRGVVSGLGPAGYLAALEFLAGLEPTPEGAA